MPPSNEEALFALALAKPAAERCQRGVKTSQ